MELAIHWPAIAINGKVPDSHCGGRWLVVYPIDSFGWFAMERMYDLPAMKRRLAEIDAERGPLVAMIEAAQRYEAGIAGKTPPVPVEPEKYRFVIARPRMRAGATAVETTEALALTMIHEAGRPVPTREIVAEMERQGLPLPNKNHVNVISARLSNSDKLKGRRDMGWWPKERPWPDQEPALKLSEGGSNVIAAA